MRLSMAPRESVWGRAELLPGRQHKDFLSVSVEDDAAGNLVEDDAAGNLADALACGSKPFWSRCFQIEGSEFQQGKGGTEHVQYTI